MGWCFFFFPVRTFHCFASFRAGYKFECPECHRRVKTADQLRAHRRTAHSDPGGPRAKCPYCELTVSAKRRSQLDRHVRRVHPEAKEDIARLEEK